MRFWTILATTTVLATFEGCGKDKAAETKTTGDSATGDAPSVPAAGSGVRTGSRSRPIQPAAPAPNGPAPIQPAAPAAGGQDGAGGAQLQDAPPQATQRQPAQPPAQGNGGNAGTQ